MDKIIDSDLSEALLDTMEYFSDSDIDLENNISEFLDIIKIFSDTTIDIVRPLKILSAINNYTQRRKFVSFLIKCEGEITKDNSFDKKSKDKLSEYMQKDKNLIIINDILKSTAYSKSIRCCEILGLIAGEILRDCKDISYEQMEVISAVERFNDYDLDNFILLYKVGFSRKSTRIASEETVYESTIYKNLKPHQQNTNSVKFSLEKIIQSNLVFSEIESTEINFNKDIDDDIWEETGLRIIKKNSAGKYLYNLTLILETQVSTQL